jgi:hypothetical protein
MPGLGPTQQREILTLLAGPRSNITTAARLLARLKNRPHRYPTMTRAAFGANERAVKIVATEYMQDPLMREFFPER